MTNYFLKNDGRESSVVLAGQTTEFLTVHIFRDKGEKQEKKIKQMKIFRAKISVVRIVSRNSGVNHNLIDVRATS